MQLKKNIEEKKKQYYKIPTNKTIRNDIKTFGFMVSHSFVWFARSFVLHSFTVRSVIDSFMNCFAMLYTLSTSMNIYWKCLFFSWYVTSKPSIALPFEFPLDFSLSFIQFIFGFLSEISSPLPSARLNVSKPFAHPILRQVYWDIKK